VSRALRVAMVGLRAPWGTEGGVEQAVAALAPRLAASGCEVTVYCRARYNTLGPGTHQGVRLVDVDTLYTRHLEAIVHTAAALPLALREHDLIHLHATGPALLSWVPRLAGRKTVVTVHGLDWQRDKWGWIASQTLRAGAWASARFPDRVIVVGRHLQDHYRQTYGIETTCIPNGVDPIGAPPLSAGEVEGLEPGRYLLFVGRLVPEKGLERLVAAWRGAGASLPLVVVGGWTYSADYVKKLRAAAPTGVIFTGPRYGIARDALLAHAAAFVYPSRVEGMPLAPLEAMAAGLPVFLSDIAPHREILLGEPGEPTDHIARAGPGWRVPEHAWEDALRLAAALGPEARAEAGRAGRLRVQADFGWDKVALRTLEVYRETLGLSNGPLQR